MSSNAAGSYAHGGEPTFPYFDFALQPLGVPPYALQEDANWSTIALNLDHFAASHDHTSQPGVLINERMRKEIVSEFNSLFRLAHEGQDIYACTNCGMYKVEEVPPCLMCMSSYCEAEHIPFANNPDLTGMEPGIISKDGVPNVR